MSVYTCRQCNHSQPFPWEELECPGCGRIVACKKKHGEMNGKKRVTAADAVDVTIKRKSTGIEKFDYVLSGGLVKKFVILLGGPKGSGKTTLMMQVLDSFSKRYGRKVLFASAEEYSEFLLANFNRIGALNDKIEIMGCPNVSDVRTVLARCKEEEIKLGVFDSLQMLGYDDMPASAQRDVAVAHAINEYCKKSGMCAVVMNHMNKTLEMVGSTKVGHDVDTELEIHHYNEKDDGRARLLFTDEVLATVEFKDIRTLLVGKIRGGESGRKSFWLTTATGLVPIEQRPTKKEERERGSRASSLRLVTEEENT